MYLCLKANETYATLNSEYEKIMSIKGKEIVGSLGRIVDKLFPKKHLRKCNLIGSTDLGEKLPNGTYTGNLGLLQSKKAIVYLKTEPQIIFEDWINYNIPVLTEKYVIDMEISEDIKHKAINDMMKNFNFGFAFTVCFFLTILSSYLIAITLNALFLNNRDKFIKRFKQVATKKTFLTEWYLINSSPAALGLFLICFAFFVWFLKLNILNNIKTNKVVVDTSNLIKNKEDALKTKRVCCFLEGSTEIAIAKISTKENIVRRLYEDKSWIKEPIKNLHNKKKTDRCIIETTQENIGLDPSGLFILFSETGILVFSVFLGSTRSGHIIWFPSKPIFEINNHAMMINEKDIVERFYPKLIAYTEAGIPVQLRKSIRQNSDAFYMVNKIYRTLEQFSDDNSKFDVLVVENFKYLFLTFFLFCSIVFLIFVLHNLYVRFIYSVKFLTIYFRDKKTRTEDN